MTDILDRIASDARDGTATENERHCAIELYSARILAKDLTYAAMQVLSFLEREEWGTINFMEGSEIYALRDDAIEQLKIALMIYGPERSMRVQGGMS